MADALSMPRLVVAGIGSGSGKTSISLGLTRALVNRGRVVQTFKAGADLVDSALLAHASGRACRTLDSWVLSADAVRRAFARGVRDADCAVIEGRGGLFDCHGGENLSHRDGGFPGSTAEVAALTHAPVALVIDVSGMVETAAAIALGVRNLASSLTIIGVILDNSSSARTHRAVEDAIWELATLPVLGCVPHMPELAIPDVAGLMSLAQNPELDATIAALGDHVARNCDIDLIERLMQPTGGDDDEITLTAHGHGTPSAATHHDKPLRVAVAFDDAFCLSYPENIEALEAAGAEIVPVSPLEDQALPRDIDAIYMAGGILASQLPRLARNHGFLESLRRAHAHGIPIYADSGGTLVLARDVISRDGNVHALAGILDVSLSLADSPSGPGYREIELTSESVVGKAGTRLRGHEFHSINRAADEAPTPGEASHAYALHDCDGQPMGCDGWNAGHLLASTVHLHFGQTPELAQRFLASAATARTTRELQRT